VHGWRTDWLMQTTTIFVVLLFCITLIWLTLACVLHGRKHKAHYDRGKARSQVIKALCLSALIFTVVDGNLFVSGLSDLDQAFWNFDRAHADPSTIRVQVNGRQWAWDMRLPGDDDLFNTADDILTTDELRVPVGAPVLLQLAATDVIHSFSLPNFRTKMDAIPGNVTRLWFQAKKVGRYEIVCQQHCGLNHYKMRGHLIVMEPAHFRRWAQEASALAARAFDADDTGAHWGWDWALQN